MVLGTSETIGFQSDGFKGLDDKLKIFERTSTDISFELIDFPSTYHYPKSVQMQKEPSSGSSDNIQTLADQILLQRFAPASVLVNAKGDIIYITGRTGKYLEPMAGKANWNIFAMARDGLRQKLLDAFQSAVQGFEAVVVSNIKVGTNGGSQFVDLTVQRLEKPDVISGMVMIVFTDVPAVHEHSLVNPRKGKQGATAREKELEIELKRNKEELQSTREKMQTSQEELKSINEELQSTNEELQSTNEELTTSKEEMQSLNEELQTVNMELQSKVNEFARANDDMKNLLNSTEIATLFLDKELNIRRFTEQLTKIFKLRNSDIGRPFTDLVTDLDYPEIDAHARQVIKTLVSNETATKTYDERWFNVRIMPYRTTDDRIDGLVMTFTDITRAKKLEIKLKEANEAFRQNRASQ